MFLLFFVLSFFIIIRLFISILFRSEMLMVSSFETFSGIFHMYRVCMCTHCKMHDNFGLRLIFTLSTRLQFTFVFTIINLLHVILLFAILFQFSAYFSFPSIACSLLGVQCKRVAIFSRLLFLILWWRVDESHLSDLCFPSIFSVRHIFFSAHSNVSKPFPSCVLVVRPCASS